MGPFKVNYKTRDGSAQATADYEHVEGTLEFAQDQMEALISIPIVDDVAYEEDEDFYCDLSDPTDGFKLGEHTTAIITIIDDDEPGTLSLEQEAITVTEKTTDETIKVVVNRKNGSSGAISCKYHTENDSAVSPADYEETEGTLEFESGQMSAEIEITIKAKGR